MSIKVLPHVAQLNKYSPPWPDIDRGQYIRLDLNECTFPLPTHAVDALLKFARSTKSQCYPSYLTLMPLLAEYAGVAPQQVLVTNGSDQAIELICRAFLAQGDRLLVAVPEFPMIRQICGVIGATVVGVPFRQDLTFPYEAYAERLAEGDVDLAVIINPNNPTGTPVELSYIAELVAEHADLPFLVDEAYFEYTGESVASLVDTHPNLIVVRTFSKAFAMAGLRLGYIIAQANMIDEFAKVRGPFDVNAVAVEVAASHLQQPEWCAERVREALESKAAIETFFAQNEIKYFPGAANFMLVEHAKRDQLVQHLMARGILVRPMLAEAIRGTFRMSVGTEEEMRSFVAGLKSFANDGA